MLDGKKQLTVQNQQYYVKLLEPLDAATNPETGYTQANARILRYVQPVDPNSLDMEESGTGGHEILKITNRSTAFSAAIGETIRVDRMGSEWSPSHGSGGQNTNPNDSGCGCDCASTGDFYYYENPTVSCWKVYIDETVFKQQYGEIILSPGTYTLCYSSSRDLWVLDIGDFLSAYDSLDNNVTSTTVLDGEMTLQVPTSGTGSCCDQSNFSICVTGTIPQPQFSVGKSAGTSYGYSNGFIDGFAMAPYNDTVVFAGPTGTGAGTGEYQNFGTGTLLQPGTGSGTSNWSDYEAGFYEGYKEGYYTGYELGYSYATTGTGWTGTGSGVIHTETISPGTGIGGP
jgi:hypothetical protein